VSRRNILSSIVYGFFTGFLAGLVGLGGAELKIPFILYFLNVPLYEMVVANLIISLATSSANFALRAQVGLLTYHSIIVAVAMIAGTVPGAYLGAYLSHRVSTRRLKAFIAFVLSLVVIRLLADLLLGAEVPNSLFSPDLELLFSGFIGAGIGIISGSIGVAGGEYRIPILVYVFALPLKIAGTASQLVSIPGMLVALLKHRDLGFATRRVLIISVMLGIPSVLGAIASAFALVSASNQVIKTLFLLILLYTIARLTAELVQRKGKE
jgi:uncharacterized membrane protein YfcA